jgi:hypothetical protein
MWDWLLSRFRRRGRSSFARAGRTRSRQSRVVAPDSSGSGGTVGVAAPEQRRPHDGGTPPWGEGGGRHRRAVPVGRPDVPGPAGHAAPGGQAPRGPVPGGPVPGGHARVAAGYADPGQPGMPVPGWPDAGLGRPDAGLGRPEPGWGRPEPGWGRPDAPGLRQQDAPGLGQQDAPGLGQPDFPGPRSPGGTAGPAQPGPAQAGQAQPSVFGGARARIRRRQAGPGTIGSPQPEGGGVASQGAGGRAAARRHGHRSSGQRSSGQRPDPAGRSPSGGRVRNEAAAPRPWYELAGGWQRADGSTHCGSLEPLVRRQWDSAEKAPPAALRAVERLARLPQQIKDLLTAAVDAIYIGPGGVPDLDDMSRLRGVPLPSGRATWDACAGAYGDRKIVVGSRPSPSPDVMCHEVGHAVDDSDAPPGRWQSDSAEFRMLYDQCLPSLVSDFHRQRGALGRREFFADAFAAIASGQRPALVDMLGGKTRVALNVMLFFNRRYGI